MNFIQDPIRGVSFPLSLDIPLMHFSYGAAVVSFKFWGLETEAAEEKLVQHSLKESFSNFDLRCDPQCTWLSINSQGTLISDKIVTPHGSVDAFPNMPGCSCEVSAQNASGYKSTSVTFCVGKDEMHQ